jgi:hypothetical protein
MQDAANIVVADWFAESDTHGKFCTSDFYCENSVKLHPSFVSKCKNKFFALQFNMIGF